MTAAELGFLSAPTVLIIDDDPEMRDFLSFAVQSWANVLTAPGGKEGIEQCREAQPDLVLLDVNMPGMDGFDVINELKHDSNTRHIPVMFITGETFQEVESECLEAGAADYVPKPVNSRVLTARSRTHILLKQQSDLLSDMTIIDAITGALTRAAFDDRLGQELSRSRRSSHHLVFALIEVEDYDQYVSTYGQLAADDMMAAVAGAIRQIARRQADIICRYGPRHMGLLLPDLPYDKAGPLLARVRNAVAELKIANRLGAEGEVRVSTRLIDAAQHATVADTVRAVEAALPE